MENHNEKTYEMKQYELCLEWFEFMTNDLFIGDKVREIIADSGTHGLIIGADCTIPSDINHERIEWVREAAIL